ncbi:MAG: hypothetical protein RJA99_947 [Pseudomonadota bacterium]|jgi:hypothetical protein
MSIRHLLPLLLVALAAAPFAHAQYKWRDANGRMVYSDMPPPASVAPSAVLQAPGRPAPAADPGGSGATAKAAAGSASGAAPATGMAVPAAPAASAADRELEFRKRRLERAEAERKAAEEAGQKKELAAACDDTRSQLRTLESGMRVSQVNEGGERVVMDDAMRASKLAAAREALKKHCASS